MLLAPKQKQTESQEWQRAEKVHNLSVYPRRLRGSVMMLDMFTPLSRAAAQVKAFFFKQITQY